MKIVRNRFIPSKNFAAINLFGVLFCHRGTAISPVLLNHERIHTRQMIEMGFIFFYLWYVAEWGIRLCMRGSAYFNLSFEREAYLYEDVPDYLKRRRLFAWWPLMKRKNLEQAIKMKREQHQHKEVKENQGS